LQDGKWNTLGPMLQLPSGQKKGIVIRIPRCGVGETFLAMKPHLDMDVAKTYCDNDFGTFDALFGKKKIQAERTEWIPEGKLYCEYTIEFKGKR